MRTASRILMSALIVVGCGTKASEPQTAAAAMQIVCDSFHRSGAESANPAERQQTISKWLAKEVTNVEIRALVESLGVLAPAPRKDALEAAAKKYVQGSCALIQALTPVLQVPEIALGGVLEREDETPMLLATPNAIVVEGKAVVALRDGAFDPAELEGGATGMRVPRLTSFLEALQKVAGSRLAIAADPTLSYGVLIRVMYSAKLAHIDHFELLVTQRGALKQIPIALPAKAPPTAANVPLPEAVPLKLVVSVRGDTLSLWSMSQLEGTLTAPKLTLPIGNKPDLAPLVRALEEILQRRFGSTAPSVQDREIVAMFEQTTPMHIVAAVLASVRATEGKELFSGSS